MGFDIFMFYMLVDLIAFRGGENSNCSVVMLSAKEIGTCIPQHFIQDINASHICKIRNLSHRNNNYNIPKPNPL